MLQIAEVQHVPLLLFCKKGIHEIRRHGKEHTDHRLILFQSGCQFSGGKEEKLLHQLLPGILHFIAKLLHILLLLLIPGESRPKLTVPTAFA